MFDPLWSTARTSAGTLADDVELYVQRSLQLNAYAAGGRSIAVTSRVLDEHRAGRVSDGQVVAVLVHELGHHATGATRPVLLAMWWSAPWRASARLLTGLGSALAGRRARQGPGFESVCVAVIAVAQAALQGRWLAGGVVGAVAVYAVICPLADAWTCRRAEFAADRFAADHGGAHELASAPRTAWSVEHRLRLVATAAGNTPDSRRTDYCSRDGRQRRSRVGSPARALFPVLRQAVGAVPRRVELARRHSAWETMAGAAGSFGGTTLAADAQNDACRCCSGDMPVGRQQRSF
ncbi:M48 family metalloprotease [Modestobacter muralis]|uniref:M48 family metalloprotease n=1 Tax=Modestobacter muralis TaxID=1608614 RepID=A0A6P0H8U1_9ACTN|nr:M48 family metalloprotease [Modestobacter muralis]NEN52142.1 M48 family metalloprotease [Modestobacter muralis]